MITKNNYHIYLTLQGNVSLMWGHTDPMFVCGVHS